MPDITITLDQHAFDRIRALTVDTMPVEKAVAIIVHQVVDAGDGDRQAGAALCELDGVRAAVRASYAAVVAEEAAAKAASREASGGAKVLRLAPEPDDEDEDRGGGKVH